MPTGCVQAARGSPRSVAVDEIQEEVGLPPVTAGRRTFSPTLFVTHRDATDRPCRYHLPDPAG
jgi:hypothetical protein